MNERIITDSSQVTETDHPIGPGVMVSGMMVPVSSGVMNMVTISGVTAPSTVTLRDVAYVVKDPNFEDFTVYASANAWWMDKTKVGKLIDAFKQGHLVETACFYAGISKRQWQYFNDVHPDFCSLIEQIDSHPLFIKAMNTIAGALDTDPKLAISYMRSRHRKFRREEQPKVEQPLMQQTVQVAVTTNVDTTKIAEAIASFGRSVSDAGRESDSAGGGGQGVEALGTGEGN